MKITFASYEHSCIGFPGVVLKWSVENGEASEGRIIINKIISKSTWKWLSDSKGVMGNIESELNRFDAWVANRHSDNPTVQG
jgi:hypothetical protein